MGFAASGRTAREAPETRGRQPKSQKDNENPSLRYLTVIECSLTEVVCCDSSRTCDCRTLLVQARAGRKPLRPALALAFGCCPGGAGGGPGHPGRPRPNIAFAPKHRAPHNFSAQTRCFGKPHRRPRRNTACWRGHTAPHCVPASARRLTETNVRRTATATAQAQAQAQPRPRHQPSSAPHTPPPPPPPPPPPAEPPPDDPPEVDDDDVVLAESEEILDENAAALNALVP